MRKKRGSQAILWALILSMNPQWTLAGDWPFRRKAQPDLPNSLEQVARSIDAVEDKIRDDGTVVLKQPDVYGQSRMTLYRKNFEQQLYGAITNFNAILSARVTRSDQAAFASQTSLQGTLASGAGNRNRLGVAPAGGAAASSATTTVVSPSGGSEGGSSLDGSGVIPSILADGSITRTGPFSGLGKAPFSTIGGGAYQLGLEPTVYLDELKNYQDHLNEIRRINMGDDIADSAGYGLYQVRMPISIQPGELTLKGHGAILTATVRHDFGPDFLSTTYRNLVINDLVDQLSPAVYELIRSGALDRLCKRGDIPSFYKRYHKFKDQLLTSAKSDPDVSESELIEFVFSNENPEIGLVPENAPGSDTRSRAAREKESRKESMAAMENELLMKTVQSLLPITRTNNRDYPVSPTDFNDVFIPQNLLILALETREAMLTQTPRATDVRSYLRRQLEATYELLPHFESMVDPISSLRKGVEYALLEDQYIELAKGLPGEQKYTSTEEDLDENDSLIDVMTILCFAISVESGLLNDQLRKDMRRAFAKDNIACDGLESMEFHREQPTTEVELAFQNYVKARWPVITFALDPVVDQQNIADASSLRRDTQLALSFAFASGQISFRQMMQYQRRLELDSETISLNRTVTTFAHGNETFGFRFSPRYQNPPQERSNAAALYNQLVKGGPGREYQTKNSKLEAGLRELNVVIIMPSFLQSVQMDVLGNWFPLHDPDEMEIPRARMIEQGRKVMKLKHDLSTLEACGEYRPGDVRRLTTQVGQLEAMLPMQTLTVRVPYENTLGGFQLFQQGVTSLVPHLDGFEGADGIDPAEETDLLIFGKHFSVQETKVIVGGKHLAGQNLDMDRAIDTAKAHLDAAQTSTEASQGEPSSAAESTEVAEPTGGADAAPAAAKSKTAAKAAATKTKAPTTKAATATKASLDAAKQTVDIVKAGISTPKAQAKDTAGVDNPYVEIVSREVLRLKIPAGTQTTTVIDSDAKDASSPNKKAGTNKANTTEYVEVFVATPNGISNRLLIPVRPKAKDSSPKAETPASGYSLANQEISLVYNVPADRTAPDPKDFVPGASHPPLTIRLNEPSGIVPKIIDVSLMFGQAENTTADPNPAAPDDAADPPQVNAKNRPKATKPKAFTIHGVPHRGNGIYEIDPSQLAGPLCTIDAVKTLFASGAGAGSVLSKTITLQPKIESGDFDVIPKSAINNVTVKLQFVLVATAPPPPPGGAVPRPGNERNVEPTEPLKPPTPPMPNPVPGRPPQPSNRGSANVRRPNPFATAGNRPRLRTNPTPVSDGLPPLPPTRPSTARSSASPIARLRP